MRHLSLRFLRVGALVVPLAVAGCEADAIGPAGACVQDSTLQCASDFLGYSCAGGARPDQTPSVGQAVQGIVCTDEGQLETNTNEDFCCTADETTCAYNSLAGCTAPAVGYSCMGADRPEAFDSDLYCGTGLRQNGLIVYCCGPASTQTQVCATNAAVACPSGTGGWSCMGPKIPGEADLGVDQSRADTPLVCSIPVTTGMQNTYCCYTPTAVPVGGTCLSDETATSCAPGAFSFACTGTDSPDQDYPRVTCTQGSVEGANPQGIAARIYCCTYNQIE